MIKLIRPKLLKGFLTKVILYIMREEEKGLTGYEACQKVSELTGGVYRPSPGAIYPVLRALESKGLIEKAQVNGRTVYKLTRNGKEHTEKHFDDIRSVVELFKLEAGSAKAKVFLSLKRIFRLILYYHDEIDEKKALEISKALDDVRKKLIAIMEAEARD